MVVAMFILVLAAVASSSSAQTIMRKPGQAVPTLPRSPGQVPREGPDPDSPYSLTVRVYVMPFDTAQSPAPGEGAHLLLMDGTGRRLGRDPITSALHDEIPDGRYEPVINPNPTMPVGPRGLAGNGIALRTPAEGRYELQVIGADHAAYEYVVQAWDRTGRPRWTHFGRGATEPGAVDRYELTYSLSLTPPIWIAEKRDHSFLTVFLHGIRQGRSKSAAVGELVLTDPRGRRLGVSPLTKASYHEIPRAYYGAASNEGSELGVPEPADGVYTLDVVGTAVGRYDLEFHPSGRTGDPLGSFQLAELPTRPGTVHRYALNYFASEGKFEVSGGFPGGNDKSNETKSFLTYAHPITAETRLRAGQSTFPLLIFYGSRILPETLRAALNGADVTKLFTPRPGGHQMVLLKLRVGENTLTLSVQGQTSRGETASDTDRLTFIVRCCDGLRNPSLNRSGGPRPRAAEVCGAFVRVHSLGLHRLEVIPRLRHMQVANSLMVQTEAARHQDQDVWVVSGDLLPGHLHGWRPLAAMRVVR